MSRAPLFHSNVWLHWVCWSICLIFTFCDFHTVFCPFLYLTLAKWRETERESENGKKNNENMHHWWCKIINYSVQVPSRLLHSKLFILFLSFFFFSLALNICNRYTALSIWRQKDEKKKKWRRKHIQLHLEYVFEWFLQNFFSFLFLFRKHKTFLMFFCCCCCCCLLPHTLVPLINSFLWFYTMIVSEWYMSHGYEIMMLEIISHVQIERMKF